MLEVAIASGLLSAFSILLMGKLGIRDYVIERGPRLISKMFDCDFCLSFWVNVALSIIFCIFAKEYFVFTAIIATPITKKLI